MTTTEIIWYSVQTPSVFREYSLPADESVWSAADHKKYTKLQELAEKHGTHVRATAHRLG